MEYRVIQRVSRHDELRCSYCGGVIMRGDVYYIINGVRVDGFCFGLYMSGEVGIEELGAPAVH